ncbi:hypothetical protein GGI43DRAFT_175236 [Trichoderma evansii]
MNSSLNRNKWDEPPILSPRELKGLLRAMQGVDSHRLDAQGRNFMHLVVTGATDNRAARLIPFLVMAGVSINQKDENGVTPLYAAAARNTVFLDHANFAAVEALLACGADPGRYERNEVGWTLFHQLLRPSGNDDKKLETAREKALRRLSGWTLPFDSYTSNPDWDCSGPLLVSDATPLFFAAAHAQDERIVHCLLINGADPTKQVRNKENVDCQKVETILGALFRHWWHTPGRIRSASWDVAKPIIHDLLSFGAILDPVDEEPSALEYACGFPAVPGAEDHELLNFLIRKAQRQNISHEHLQKVIIDGCRRLWSTPPHTETSRYFHTITWRLMQLRQELYPNGDVSFEDEDEEE